MDGLHHLGDILKDRYRLLEPLGQGGMATTYAAEDLQQHCQVAIKIMSLRSSRDWKLLELFEREAKVLANLDHPAIPKYIDYFQSDTPSDRRFYLVQALAEGDSLANLVSQGWHSTEEEVRLIATQVLETLIYLHQLTPPVIHRDIKPQNLIRDRSGKIYLVDFGAVQDVYRNTVTKGSTFVGTYGYMPPEQYRGEAYFASDLYALGATLLYVLTHRSPNDLPQKRMKIDFRGRVNISSGFADWLEVMLEPMVEDRFHSAQEALAVLQAKRFIAPIPAVPAVVPKPDRSAFQFLKPKGTRIQLHRDGDHLYIFIPPHFSIVNLFFGNFPMILGGLVFCLGVITLFTLFVVLPLAILYIFAVMMMSIQVRMDRQTFSIVRLVSSWQLFSERGVTADIVRVEKRIHQGRDRTTSSCTIWEGVKAHNFGRNLLEVEQDWLITEIQNFLDDL